MAWTQDDLDVFDAELKARGTVTGITSADGQSASFSSLAEAMTFRAQISAEINAATSPPKNIRYAVTSKGA